MVLEHHPSTEEAAGRCLACAGLLSLAPDCYPLVFYCNEGHLFTLNDLLANDFPRGKVDPGERLWLTLRTWEARARSLHEVSGRALRDGHTLAAADFKEAAGRIERWTYSLATLLGACGFFGSS